MYSEVIFGTFRTCFFILRFMGYVCNGKLSMHLLFFHKRQLIKYLKTRKLNMGCRYITSHHLFQLPSLPDFAPNPDVCYNFTGSVKCPTAHHNSEADIG